MHLRWIDKEQDTICAKQGMIIKKEDVEKAVRKNKRILLWKYLRKYFEEIWEGNRRKLYNNVLGYNINADGRKS